MDRQRELGLEIETMPTGQQSTGDGLQKRLRLLQHVEELYGSGIRETVERTLSEFMATETSRTRTTSNRAKAWKPILSNLSTLGLTERDKLMVIAQAYTENTNWDWSVQQHKTGILRVTARRRRR